ncbi:MAG: hypothetical protein WCO75_03060 [Planctomycetota bacterium]
MRNTFFTACAAALLFACPVALAQDECATAPTLVTGVGQAFNTTTATATALPAVTDALCTGTFLNWGTSKDVWFKWTATGAGTATFTTCFAGSYDTSMVLYSGSCASLVAVGCNGDGPADAGCQNYYSLITQAVTSGTTYYARIGGYNGATGAGQITVNFTPAASGCPGTGDCGLVHATPGCLDATCCGSVCALDTSCCDTSWSQGCVDLAVSQCGIFIYSCTPGGPANNCATSPTLVTGDSSKPFNNIGATQDGPNYGATCASGNDQCNNDVWYRFTAVANGEATASNCGTTTIDTKMAIYDMGTNPATFNYNTLPNVRVGCNDDGASGTCNMTDGQPYASSLTVSVTVGHTYLVNVCSYTLGDTGTGSVLFNLPEPCSLPSYTTAEVETCGQAINNGCVSTVAQYQSINLVAGAPTTIGGTFWASGGTRDVDAYVFTIPSGMTVTAETFSASNMVTTLYKGLPCATQYIASGTGACPRTLSYCLPAGTYSMYVAPSDFDLNPCGNGVFNNYVLKLTAVPATCPSFGDTCAYTVASTVTQNTSQTITVYSRGCVLYCGTPESRFSTEVKIARSFPGLTSGALGCVTLGVSNVDYGTDGVAYAGSPFTAKIGLYRDTDGGDPVGPELVLISEKSFSVLGGNGFLTWSLDAPLSLTGNTNPIVVVMSAPIAVGCAAATNQVFGGVGGAGSTAPWYVQSTDPNGICDSGGVFVPQVDQTNQWIVNLGMVQTTPPCPADLNGDHVVNGADLGLLLGSWGACPGCPADLNHDGIVNGADLGLMLGSWGPCPV